MPRVVSAGQVAAHLNDRGSKLLGGLPVGTPIAPPEGDQQATLVASAADELEIAISAGTSFTGNLPCRTKVVAEDETINVLQTPDRLTMLMVCVRNGTVGFGQYASGLSELSGQPFAEVADQLTDLAQQVPVDCYGALLMGFFQGENVVELPHSKAAIMDAGIEILRNPGVMARLLLEMPCMTMRYGIESLRSRIGDIRRVILSGGVLKSKDGFAPQMLADILCIPVVARSGDEEGTARGAALLAAYMVHVQSGNTNQSLAEFSKQHATPEEQIWEPDANRQAIYSIRYAHFASRVAEMNRATGATRQGQHAAKVQIENGE